MLNKKKIEDYCKEREWSKRERGKTERERNTGKWDIEIEKEREQQLI